MLFKVVLLFIMLFTVCFYSFPIDIGLANECKSIIADGNKMNNDNIGKNTINETSLPLMELLYVANSAIPYISSDKGKISGGLYTKPGEKPEPHTYEINEEIALLYGCDPVSECHDNSHNNNGKIMKPTTNPNNYITFPYHKNTNNLMVINPVPVNTLNIIDLNPYISAMWLDITANGILCVADSSNNVTLMDTNSNNSILSIIPLGNNIICDTAIGNSDARLFCALMGAEPSVGVIDISSGKYIKTINLPKLKDGTRGQPWGIGTAGNMVYVTLGTPSGGELAFINTNANSLEGTATVGQNPFGAGAIPDGSKIYVANQNSETVSVVDGKGRNVIGIIPVGKSPVRVAVSSDGSKVVVTNKDSNNVSVIDVKTDTVIKTLTTGKEPVGVCISKDGKRAYVVNHGSDDITIIDLINDSVIGNTTPFTGGKPYDVVVK